MSNSQLRTHSNVLGMHMIYLFNSLTPVLHIIYGKNGIIAYDLGHKNKKKRKLHG